MANINAEKLRRGNYVWDNYSGVMIVAEIRESYLGLRKTKDLPIGRYETAEPIPLTEEWLVEFGATTYEFDNGQPNQYRIGEDLYVIRDGVITDYGTSVKLPFVHTLQNLYFAKRGKELTLQNNKQ